MMAPPFPEPNTANSYFSSHSLQSLANMGALLRKEKSLGSWTL
jgi:hypothetical protein